MKTLISILFVTTLSSSVVAQNNGRLVGTRTVRFSGSTVTPLDSAKYVYLDTTHGGQADPQIIDSLVSYDVSNHLVYRSDWQDSLRITKTYDSLDHPLTRVEEAFDGQNWTFLNKQTYSPWKYISTDSLIYDTITQYAWNNKWQGTSRRLFQRDWQRNPLEVIFQQWSSVTMDWENTVWIDEFENDHRYWHAGPPDTQAVYHWISGAWQPQSRKMYFPFLQDSIYSLTTQQWNTTDGVWENIELSMVHYEISYPRDSIVQLWSNGTWVNHFRRVFDYYPWLQKKQLRVFDLTWDLINSEWDSVRRLTTDSYDQYFSRTVDSTEIFLAPDTWKTVARNFYYRPDYGRPPFLTREVWDDSSNAWRGVFKNSGVFSGGQYQTYSLFDWTDTGWVLATTKYFWYEPFIGPVSVSRKEPVRMFTKAFPNPFTTGFTIEFSTPIATPVALFLYNAEGKLLTRTVSTAYRGSNRITWDAFRLPTGSYTYCLIADEYVGFGKIVAQ